MKNQAKNYLTSHFLKAQIEIPVKILLQLSIEKLREVSRSSQEYKSAFHYINILISEMSDGDPNKAVLIKKLYNAENNRLNTAPLKIVGPFLVE